MEIGTIRSSSVYDYRMGERAWQFISPRLSTDRVRDDSLFERAVEDCMRQYESRYMKAEKVKWMKEGF
jgi:hypothetical protein